MDITWTEEPPTSQKFHATPTGGPDFELTLTRANDGTVTASMTQNITTNLGSMVIPGDWPNVKAFFTEVGAAL